MVGAALPSLDATIGAALVGFAASSVVYGVVTTQVWTYFNRQYPSDRFYKYLVALVWLITSTDQALIGHSVYFYTITNYANPIGLITNKPTWSLSIQILTGALSGTIVKTAFALRVWRISNHNLVATALLMMCTFSGFGLAIVFSVRSLGLASLTQLESLKLIATLALGAGVVTDVCTAIALCFYLQKLRTEFSRSNALVNSLTRHVIDCGIMTSAFSLTTLVLYNVNPNNFIYMCTYFVLSKFYATSLLAALNARKVSATGRASEVRSELRSADQEREAGFNNRKINLGPLQRDPSRPTRHFSAFEDVQFKIDVRREIETFVSTDLPYDSETKV